MIRSRYIVPLCCWFTLLFCCSLTLITLENLILKTELLSLEDDEWLQYIVLKTQTILHEKLLCFIIFFCLLDSKNKMLFFAPLLRPSQYPSWEESDDVDAKSAFICGESSPQFRWCDAGGPSQNFTFQAWSHLCAAHDTGYDNFRHPGTPHRALR